MQRQLMGAVIAAALLAAACSGGDDDQPAAEGTTAGTTAISPPDATSPSTDPPTSAPALSPEAQQRVDEVNATDAAPECEHIGWTPISEGASGCYLPFPSDYFTVADDATTTGLRVALPTVLSNVDGTPLDLTEWNRNDGFSPNTPILVQVPGIDAEQSNLPPWTDLGRSLQPDQPVVLVDLTDGAQIPLWAELDAKAADDDDRLLEVHPAIALPEGHTFAIGLRNLKSADGSVIDAPLDFQLYRDGGITDAAWFEQRRPMLDNAFTALGQVGVTRGDLQLAWTFTTASTDNIAGRMLHIRDTALAQLETGTAPEFTITDVLPNTDDNIAVQVRGTYTVPNFLTGNGDPGNGFYYSPDDADNPDRLPTINPDNPTLQAGFVCNISAATATGDEPAHLVQYGHGLLGSNDEINAGNVRAFANEHNVVFCATKWAGMSEDDVGNAAATLSEFSNFHTIADRLQQGVLNQIFLGRLMIGAGGLGDDATFQRADGTPLIDTAHLDYDGNSQGAIMGLMLTAVSPDIERSVVGVAGMNYSVLLSRSVDFDTYEAIFKPAYPNDMDRVLILSLTQMLWDRGEGAGYVQHITSDPYPGTETKQILVHVALGDWQVSELTAFIAARTMGITIHQPVTAPGRSDEVEPGWGLLGTVYPSDGSAIVIWDSGSDLIPFANVPPRSSRDPHEDPRADADVRNQKAAFLFDDTLIDVCDGAPCTADARD